MYIIQSNHQESLPRAVASHHEAGRFKFDVLCASFPCQPFNLTGVSARNSLNTAHGFACETQGTLFFDVMRIVAAKKPAVIFLENVKNLVRHDQGKTFAVIKKTIADLDYSFSYAAINA